MAVNLPNPLAPETKDVWGAALNTALTTLDDAISTAVSTAQSAATLAGNVNTALASKADLASTRTNTANDARYVRTINGSPADVAGNITVSPVPGVRVIYWDGTGTHPLRTSQSSDLTQMVIWVTPFATPPTIGTNYAVNGVDSWWAT